MVDKKVVHIPKHSELTDKKVPTLHVMKAMQSLTSWGYMTEPFAQDISIGSLGKRTFSIWDITLTCLQGLCLSLCYRHCETGSPVPKA